MVNKFVKFSYENLRNETHTEFNEDVRKILTEHISGFPQAEVLFNAYKTAFEHEIDALDIVRKSALTAEINAQDSKRDDVFRGLTAAVKSATHHYDSVKRAAAVKLQTVFDNYGNIAARTLDAESAAIDDILREFETDDNRAAVEEVGLSEWAARLQTENEKFKDLMHSRYAEIAARPTISMRAARTETDRKYRVLVDFIEAFAHSGDSAADRLITVLNPVLTRYKNIMAQEKHRKLIINN